MSIDTMTTAGFAKYVVDQIVRATCSNALNISERFISKKYDFREFIQEVIKYMHTVIDSGAMDPNTCYDIFSICNTALKKINNKVKYNEEFVYNDFIIDLWRISHGCFNT